MSDLLNKASLVMVPSGYKEDTVYSVVPTDGSGDLSFTRASNGTRVNSAGLVEVCPWNLLQQSETFDNGYWNKGAASITANATTAPNGTTTADKFIESATLDTHQVYVTFVGNTGVSTLFIYAKKAERSAIQITSDQATDPSAIFNLDTGVIYSSDNCTPFIESVGNGWYKCGITYTIDQTTSYPVFRVADSSFNTVYAGTANYGIYIWGAQLNIGSTAKPYFPTTDRLNVPRLTYQNGGGGCPSLLLEKQSTNIASYSEQFDNASWTKSATTVTANATTAPDGTMSADKIIADNTLSNHKVSAGFSPSNVVYSFSIFAKKAEYSYIRINTGGPSWGGAGFVVDLDNGNITLNNLPETPVVMSMSNGWYRISISKLATSTVSIDPEFIGVPTSTASNTYQGNGTSGIYVWGAQLEESSYPTSYIPTTSSSATRVADECYKTGISSLIGQTEGVVFLDSYFDEADKVNLSIHGGTSSNIIQIETTSGAGVVANINSGGVSQASMSTSSSFFTSGQRLKIAIAYKVNDFALYINGVQIATDSSGSVPSTDQLIFARANGSLAASQRINLLILFPDRLTNSELASLTTI